MEQAMFNPKKTAAIAIALFFIDAFVMNQGAIAIIFILVIIFWLLPKSAFLKYKGKSPKVPLGKAAIYGAMALAVFLANYANNQLAKHRAQNLITAIEQYHLATGAYPATLTDLVPTYMPNIPLAKYALPASKFWYINHQDTVSLFYISLPPFGRPTYSFNRQSWGYID